MIGGQGPVAREIGRMIRRVEMVKKNPAQGWPRVDEVFDEKYGIGAWQVYKKTLDTSETNRNWFELTKLLRFSEKLRCCGNPLGLAKAAPAYRRGLIARFEEQLAGMSQEQRKQREEAIEALATALDAERFCHHLPTLTGDIENRTAQIDEFAERLLMWLENRGSTVITVKPGRSQPESA